MESLSDLLHAAAVALVALALNLPFGAWRSATRRFSKLWFLAVHLPVPVVLLARVATDLSARLIPVLVVAAVAGQVLGSWGYTRLNAARRRMPAAVPATPALPPAEHDRRPLR